MIDCLEQDAIFYNPARGVATRPQSQPDLPQVVSVRVFFDVKEKMGDKADQLAQEMSRLVCISYMHNWVTVVLEITGTRLLWPV